MVRGFFKWLAGSCALGAVSMVGLALQVQAGEGNALWLWVAVGVLAVIALGAALVLLLRWTADSKPLPTELTVGPVSHGQHGGQTAHTINNYQTPPPTGGESSSLDPAPPRPPISTESGSSERNAFLSSPETQRWMQEARRSGERWLDDFFGRSRPAQPLPTWAAEGALGIRWRQETRAQIAMIRGPAFDANGGGVISTGGVSITNRTNRRMRLVVNLVADLHAPFGTVNPLHLPAMRSPASDSLLWAGGYAHIGAPFDLDADGGHVDGYLSFLVPASYYFFGEQAGVDLAKGLLGTLYVQIIDDVSGESALMPLGTDYPYAWSPPANGRSGAVQEIANDLDLAITPLGSQAFRLVGGAEELGRGWLYMLDLRITNRESDAVTLVPDLRVMTDPADPEKGPRLTLPALEAPPKEVEEDLRRIREANGELGMIDHLPAPIVIPARATVRGYVSYRLPEIAIPRVPGGIDEATPEVSQDPPDTDRLRFRDELSGRVYMQRYDGFQMQRIDAMSRRIVAAANERTPPGDDMDSASPRGE